MVMPFVYGKGHRNLLTKEQSDEQQVLLKEFGSYVIDQLEEKYRGFVELDEGGYRLEMNAP